MRSLRARLATLAALLAVEGGLLAGCFDAEPLLGGSHAWWAYVLARAGVVMPLAVAVLTATVLLAGPRLFGDLAASIASAPPRRVWPALCVHLAAFALLFALTALLFGRPASARGATAALWALAGLATALSAAATALPARALLTFVRRFAGLLAASVAVGVVAWGAGQVTSTWWESLGRSTMWTVYRLLALFARDPIVAPEYFVVGTQSFQVEIARQCSGYEGIGLVTVFLAVYLWVFRASLRFPRALLLLPLATVTMWFANVGRIAGLIAVGTLVSREVAVGGFHANSGSLLLCGVALGFGWWARRSPFFTVAGALPARTPVRNPAAAYLLPLVAIIATAMLTGAFARDGFDPLYGLRVLTAAAALWVYRRERSGWAWRWSWEAVAVGLAVFGLWLVLEPAPAAASGRSVGDALAAMPAAWAGLWLVFRVAGAVITVPLSEELAFRGFVARRLMARDFERVPFDRLSALAIVGSSLLFGAMHDRLLAATLAGAAYAAVLGRRGALGDAVLAHMTTNAALAVWVLTTGRWALW